MFRIIDQRPMCVCSRPAAAPVGLYSVYRTIPPTTHLLPPPAAHPRGRHRQSARRQKPSDEYSRSAGWYGRRGGRWNGGGGYRGGRALFVCALLRGRRRRPRLISPETHNFGVGPFMLHTHTHTYIQTRTHTHTHKHVHTHTPTLTHARAHTLRYAVCSLLTALRY